MLISVVNLSDSVSNEELLKVVRAINRQIAEDFEPYWSFGARLRLEGRLGRHMDKQTLPDLRGDAVLYLTDKIDIKGVLGYHVYRADEPQGPFARVTKSLVTETSFTDADPPAGGGVLAAGLGVPPNRALTRSRMVWNTTYSIGIRKMPMALAPIMPGCRT